jgi:predicted adenylyl cyclase CyaB
MIDKNSKQIIVELRAWIDYPKQVKKHIEGLGARLDYTQTFIDHYYGGKGIALNLLWEEAGQAIRIREYTPKVCVIFKKEGVVTTKDGKFTHGASKMSVLFKGTLEKSKKFLEKAGYTQHLLDIKKTRETYTLNSMGICLDEFEKFGPAMEVILRVDKVEKISKAKDELLKFLKGLGLKDYNIENASITNKILVSQLSRDPEVKKAALEEQLKEYEAQLKECLAKRGEAYVLGGDGWHDNPAFDALEAEYDFLKSRIRLIKNELLELRTIRERV